MKIGRIVGICDSMQVRSEDTGWVDRLNFQGRLFQIKIHLHHLIRLLRQTFKFHNHLFPWLQPILLLHAHHHPLRRPPRDHNPRLERQVLTDVVDMDCNAENYNRSVGILARLAVNPAIKSQTLQVTHFTGSHQILPACARAAIRSGRAGLPGWWLPRRSGWAGSLDHGLPGQINVETVHSVCQVGSHDAASSHGRQRRASSSRMT